MMTDPTHDRHHPVERHPTPTPSWAGSCRTADGSDDALVPCDTCGGPVYESCRTNWRARGQQDCGVGCEPRQTSTPGDGTDGRSGWCGRGAHQRCTGVYDRPCECVCHEDAVDAVLLGVDAAFERLSAGGVVTVAHLTFRWFEVLEELLVTAGNEQHRYTLAEFGAMLDAAWGRDRTS